MRAVLSYSSCSLCLLALACEPVVLGSDVSGGAGGMGSGGLGGNRPGGSGGLSGDGPSAGGAPLSAGTGAATTGGTDAGGAGAHSAVGGASGCCANGSSGTAGEAGLAGAGDTAGAAGAGDTAGAAGAGGAAGVAGEGGIGGWPIPEDAEPPAAAPITAMAEQDGHVVAGDLLGNVYCRTLVAGPAWTLCNSTDIYGRTVLPSRPVSALRVGRDGLALVAIVPASPTDVVVYQNGSVGMRPWVSTPLQGLTVYGLSEVPGPSPWQVAVTDAGLYEASNLTDSWWPASGADRISSTLLVPEGLLAGAWLGTASGGLYQVDDPLDASASTSWARVEITPAASAPVVSIARDPVDTSRAYVSVASVNPSGLYLSRDGGYTYASQQLPLPAGVSGALSAVSVNPLAPHVLYLVAFTPDAVPLRSTDAGRSWQVMGP